MTNQTHITSNSKPSCLGRQLVESHDTEGTFEKQARRLQQET